MAIRYGERCCKLPGSEDCIELNELKLKASREVTGRFFMITSIPRMEAKSMVHQRKRRGIRRHQCRVETQIRVCTGCIHEVDLLRISNFPAIVPVSNLKSL